MQCEKQFLLLVLVLVFVLGTNPESRTRQSTTPKLAKSPP